VADSALLGLRTASACGACGKAIAADAAQPATFCRECGCSLLLVTRAGQAPPSLDPFVAPRVDATAAWARLKAAGRHAESASMTGSRLLFVPFHEWAPDLSRTRLVKDARSLFAPAADLLPSGLPGAPSPSGEDLRGLAVAETAHKGRLADPSGTVDLIRQGEIVDVMLPPPDHAPDGADPACPPRLLYYPLWFITYRIDWTERRGVVNAVTGEPVGPSSAPVRFRAAALAAVAGLVSFAAVSLLLSPLGMPVIRSVVAGAISCAAAALSLARLLRGERGR